MTDTTAGPRTGLPLALYFVSGAAGLTYEIAWARLFTLHLGGLVPALLIPQERLPGGTDQ